ncbi:cellulase family glycosylhydrolase [Streptomyces sp. NPDC005533]|uniref:cellulase family glycosylhydrolase n=1 Tax=Streptomyces sp. NPDC005533 TaxID=3364723 RepID=UPI0036CEF2F1
MREKACGALLAARVRPALPAIAARRALASTLPPRTAYARRAVRRRLAVAAGAGVLLLAVCVPSAGAGAVPHTFPDSTLAAHVSLAPSTVVSNDQVFVDGYGRQVVMRGYAVSGSVKLKESGLLPFRNRSDAAASFTALRQEAGSNVVRFQLLWEGTEPTPGTLNTVYLDKAIAQIHEATSRGLRVIVEYHQDLQGRALFKANSKYTGEGMPDWVIGGLGLTGTENCFACSVEEEQWGQANVADFSGVRRAAQYFWNNQAIVGSTVGIRDSFVRHAKRVLAYLKSKLKDDSWKWIVGFEPINSPIDGGMDKGVTSQQWDEQTLWPFYRSIRKAMDETGWQEKLEFAEPNVFWNSQIGDIKWKSVIPIRFPSALGTSPDPQHTLRIVFTPHYYDVRRALPDDLRPADADVPAANGEYLSAFDNIRAAARTWGTPAFVSEFGATVDRSGYRDTARELAAMYQGINSGQGVSLAPDGLDYYAPVLSGTQWHWDIYRNHHNELKNGNPDKVQIAGDAWNGEDHSVIERNDAQVIKPMIDRNLIAQAYPQAVQGGLLNFQYNSHATDSPDTSPKTGTALNWLQLCPGGGQNCYFKTARFLFEAWKGRNSDAPTQTYLPSQFAPPTTTVITDSGIYKAANLSATPAATGKANEVVLRGEPHTTNAGRQLLYWTDPLPLGTSVDKESRHFLLVIADTPNTLKALGYGTEAERQAFLRKLQADLITSMNKDTNPVRLARATSVRESVRLDHVKPRAVVGR